MEVVTIFMKISPALWVIPQLFQTELTSFLFVLLIPLTPVCNNSEYSIIQILHCEFFVLRDLDLFRSLDEWMEEQKQMNKQTIHNVDLLGSSWVYVSGK